MTSSTPSVTGLRVIPVAGRDSMLLNLSGAHAPFFTRNLLVLSDSAGRTGVGEVPGGEKIRQTLADAAELVVGQPIGWHRRVLQAVQARFADRDRGGRGSADIRSAHDDPRRDGDRVGAARPPRPASRRSRRRPPRRRPAARRRRDARLSLLRRRRFEDRSAVRTRAGRRRRVAAPAPRAGADAGGDRPPRRSGACALRLQRLQAEGRRTACRRGDRGRAGAVRSLPGCARDDRSERRLAAERRGPPHARPARRPCLCGRSVRRGRRLLGTRGHGRVPARDRPRRPRPTWSRPTGAS